MKAAQRYFALQSDECLREDFANNMQFLNDLSKYVNTYPQGVILQWKPVKNAKYQVTYSTSKDFTDGRILETDDASCTIYNLFIGHKYYWKVTAVDSTGQRADSDVFEFKVENLPPRIMNVPGIDNMRDLGGRIGLEGRVAKQGMIYRSSGLNANSVDRKTPGAPRFTQEGLDVLTNEVKIKTEIDLRYPDETVGMTKSPVPSIENYYNIHYTSYGDLISRDGQEQTARLFRIFCDKDNYPIDFHCIVGADRTGALAFVLGAALGYSEHDLLVDYTFTTFYSARHPGAYDRHYSKIMSFGEKNDTLTDNIERYLFAIGITPAELKSFREIMLGPGIPSGRIQKELEFISSFDNADQNADYGIELKTKRDNVKAALLCGKNVQKKSVEENLILKRQLPDGSVQFLNKRGNDNWGLPLVLDIDKDKLTERQYCIFSPDRKIVYLNAGKDNWKAKDLEHFSINLPDGMYVLQIGKAGEYDKSFAKVEARDAAVYSAFMVNADSRKPVIDGKLDDAIWKSSSFRSYNPVLEKDDGLKRKIACAYDKSCSVLYIAAVFEDNFMVCNENARDSAVYHDDSLELFISCMGNKKIYHLIFNANNVLYDEIDMEGPKWNVEKIESMTVKNDNGWQIEIALPLEQFGFDSIVEFNSCMSDIQPGGVIRYFDLWPTRGCFHSRNAMFPLVSEH